MDRYICLKKSDIVIPAEGEEESSGDEDGEDDGDEDEDEDEEDDDENGEGSGDDGPVPGAARQEPVEVEEEVEVKEEDVGDPFSHTKRWLIHGIGSTCQSHAVLGRFERYRSICGRCNQYPTSWRDVGNVLRQIS